MNIKGMMKCLMKNFREKLGNTLWAIGISRRGDMTTPYKRGLHRSCSVEHLEQMVMYSVVHLGRHTGRGHAIVYLMSLYQHIISGESELAVAIDIQHMEEVLG